MNKVAAFTYRIAVPSLMAFSTPAFSQRELTDEEMFGANDPIVSAPKRPTSICKTMQEMLVDGFEIEYVGEPSAKYEKYIALTALLKKRNQIAVCHLNGSGVSRCCLENS